MELKPWVAPRSNLSFLPTSPASEALYFLLPLEWGEEFLRLEEEVSQLRKGAGGLGRDHTHSVWNQASLIGQITVAL